MNATPQQLEQLIAALGKNAEKMDALLARDPAKEFAYREGNVGASNELIVSPKMEVFPYFVQTGAAPITTAFGEVIHSSSLYVQRTRVSWFARGTNQGAADWALCADFSNELAFNTFFRVYLYPTVTELTGPQYIYRWDREFLVRRRFVRYSLRNQIGGTITTAMNVAFASADPLITEFYGE